MTAGKIVLTFIGMMAALCGIVSAQTNYVVVTNVVTITVTNYVTVTNVVAPMPAPAPVPAVAAIPPPVVAVPKYPWLFDASLGFTLIRGTTESDMLNAAFGGQKKTPFDEYKFGLNGDYGNQNGTESVNDYKAFGQWNHLFTPRFYGYIRVDGLRDMVADVDYRATVGPGLGYYLVKNARSTLALEAGNAFEAQQLDHEGDTYFDTLRGAERYEYKINNHVRIWQNVEILPQVDRWENFTMNFEIGVEASLSKSFTLKSFLVDNYNSQPPSQKTATDAKILHNDAKIVTALDYKF
jgi:putative salt-induced outer membrane protein YdiY